MQKFLIITGVVFTVSTIFFLWIKLKKKSVDFRLIIDECIKNEKNISEDVTSKLLAVCKESEKEVAIYAYQKHLNGKVTRRKITVNFELSDCPLEVKNKLSDSGQAIVYSF